MSGGAQEPARRRYAEAVPLHRAEHPHRLGEDRIPVVDHARLPGIQGMGRVPNLDPSRQEVDGRAMPPPVAYGNARATSSAGSPRALIAIAMYCLPSIM